MDFGTMSEILRICPARGVENTLPDLSEAPRDVTVSPCNTLSSQSDFYNF